MGRNSRLKKFRKAARAKLEKAGLQDKQFLVVKKTKNVPELILKDGKPDFDENGRPKFKMVKVEIMQARNPMKSLIRKLMRQDESTIKAFLGTPEPSSNQEK